MFCTSSHILVGLVSQWTRQWAEWPKNQGLYPDGGKEIFPFSKAFKLALRPTQPPKQWTLGDISPGVKQPVHTSTAKLKNVWYSAELSARAISSLVNEPADSNYFTWSYKMGFRELCLECPSFFLFGQGKQPSWWASLWAAHVKSQ